MLLFAHALGIASWLAAGGLLAALVACALRQWSAAKRISGWLALAGLAVFVLLVSTCVSLWVVPKLLPVVLSFPPGVENPSQKARFLAESISETMNEGALVCIAAAPSALIWIFARWRLRLAIKPPTGD